MTHRFRQIWLAVIVRSEPPVDVRLFPNPRVHRLFRSLAFHDQRHLVAVHHAATADGLDPVACLATLLHDVGKASLSGKQVTLTARIVRVLRECVTGHRGVQFTTGEITVMGMTRNHAAIGAERLRALGVSEAACRIVEVHDHDHLIDPTIIRLQEIDSSTP